MTYKLSQNDSLSTQKPYCLIGNVVCKLDAATSIPALRVLLAILSFMNFSFLPVFHNLFGIFVSSFLHALHIDKSSSFTESVKSFLSVLLHS